MSELSHHDRERLESLRYAVNDEAPTYVAIMRLFTTGISGLLSDQGAAEIAAQLAEQGIDLELDVVEDRLSYLVEHGNLARSPRETEAKSIKEYLTTRARYQLTHRGEVVHRHVEELLTAAETAREVSSEMLGGILAALARLNGYHDARLAGASPDEIAREITTMFAQFERLVDSTRDFYAYLSEVLRRFDLDREQFKAYKAMLLDYLHRFVNEISLHMPQIGEAIEHVEPRLPALLRRANDGQRLTGIDGSLARRDSGLQRDDWLAVRQWFLGERGRPSDATQVRVLATDAMGALLANLRRIVSSGANEASRYRDLVTLAAWFDRCDDDTAHALYAAAFGLYPCRHLSFVADHDRDVTASTTWWRAPGAEVPLTLRTYGDRTARGRPGRRADYAETKARRLAERAAEERRRLAAYAELAQHTGTLRRARMSDGARRALLDLYSRAISGVEPRLSGRAASATDTSSGVQVSVWPTPGESTEVISPQGRLILCDLTLEVGAAADREESSEESA